VRGMERNSEFPNHPEPTAAIRRLGLLRSDRRTRGAPKVRERGGEFVALPTAPPPCIIELPSVLYYPQIQLNCSELQSKKKEVCSKRHTAVLSAGQWKTRIALHTLLEPWAQACSSASLLVIAGQRLLLGLPCSLHVHKHAVPEPKYPSGTKTSYIPDHQFQPLRRDLSLNNCKGARQGMPPERHASSDMLTHDHSIAPHVWRT